MRRVFSFALTLIFIFLLYTAPVFADDENWDISFGDGYSNLEQHDAKIAAVLSALSGKIGISPDFIADSQDISGAKRASYTILRKLQEFDSSLYSFIDENTEFDLENGRAKLKMFDDFFDDAAPGKLPDSLTEFYEYLYGDNALRGDPFEASVQSLDTVNIDGTEYIPWRVNKTLNGLWLAQNISIITARGQFIVPDSYAQFWADTYYSTNSKRNISWDIDGQTLTTASINPYEARSLTNATYGPVKDMMIKQGTNTYSAFFNFYTTDNASAFAWLPVITTDNKLAICHYAYVYKGTFMPGSWGNNRSYLLLCITGGLNASAHLNSGDNVEYSSNGVNLEIGDSFWVEGDTYSDIVTNYYTDSNFIINNYTDPSTWDTSITGNLTDDGEGNYTLDFGNLQLPDLNIDWELKNLSQKFPFCIPRDIVRFFSVFEQEPVTPSISGTIDLGLYSWDVDFDLHEFDALAEKFRNVFYIMFIIGLLLSTRSFLNR